MNIANLFLPLSSLKRVGLVVSSNLQRLVHGDKISDLLLHKPLKIEPIAICPRLFEVKNGELVIVKVKVESHTKPEGARQPYKVSCYSPSGYVNLVFFKIFPNQVVKMAVGKEILVLGYIQRSFIGRKMELQIVHPQEILSVDEIEKMPQINVIYPLTAGITQKFLGQKIKEVLSKIDENNDEWIDIRLLEQQGWSSFFKSLKTLHYFNAKTLDEKSFELARKRLSYDELLAWQMAVLLTKANNQRQKKFNKTEKNLAAEFLKNLPFDLTNAQKSAILEIEKEIFSTKKMLRLLQGDVGSGKTVVAIAACLLNTSQNKQSCVIVPISILAKQHFAYFKKLLEKFDVQLELLTSATTKKQREKILEKLNSGEIDILISTHAVLEDDVKFKNLGLAVIDEQHRFGVMQRLKLVEKGEDCDVLLMSATPIPRSLMMGLYGDMDISVLNEKPKNRQKIETLVMSEKKIDDVYEAIKRAVLRGEKIYWICPMIDKESEDSAAKNDENLPKVSEINLADATSKYKDLATIFGEENVALIHGKMKESEKEKVMNRFIKSEAKILVATTVIEVGIDVPDATIILIENAEMFGLSQLHQLRGRVGRSDKKSFCILLYGEKYGAKGRQRLGILRESNDGFYIAEEDLKIRGSGDLIGTNQSGFPEFRIADLNFDSDLLKMAHKNAEVILHNDPKLQNAKHQNLLKFFSYDDFLKMVSGG